MAGSLAAAALFAIGCGDAGFGAEPKPTLAPTSIPPTFIRVSVTPHPTETPTPTPVPTATLAPYEIDYGPPEFPADVDPDLVEDRPEDEDIIQAWTTFLSNTSIDHPNTDSPIHLCSNGVVMTGSGLNPVLQNWRASFSPAISFLDWGTISVKVDIVSGRWEGRTWDALTLVRRNGTIFVTNNPNPGEATIERSEVCLASL